MTAPIATEQRNDLYWAVVEHVRTWLRDDGPFIQEIKRGNGALNGRTLRRIATTYKVSRGIPRGGADGDTHAEALARLINDTNWPSELVPRAKVCANLAREANEKRYTHGIQTSAITKFSWFAQPLGWTPYDTFTARAMGFRGARTVCSMVSFYAELQQRGFSELAEQVQSVMDSRQIMALHSRARQTDDANWGRQRLGWRPPISLPRVSPGSASGLAGSGGRGCWARDGTGQSWQVLEPLNHRGVASVGACQ